MPLPITALHFQDRQKHPNFLVNTTVADDLATLDALENVCMDFVPVS